MNVPIWGGVVCCFGAASFVNVPICGGVVCCFGAALRACGALHRMNVRMCGGVVCWFGAALRACGALPRAPACWERSANRVLTHCHAEAFGTPSLVSWGDQSVPARHWDHSVRDRLLGH